MTIETWDPDQAVTRGPMDEALEGCCSIDRYGVLESEELAGEPLAVALQQEEDDVAPDRGADDQWVFVEDEEWDLADRLFTEDFDGPEGSAMHVVRP